MVKSDDKKVEINIDAELIAAAESALEQLPKTADEMIEMWIYLGLAVANQLTEYEQLLLMSGNAKVTVVPSK